MNRCLYLSSSTDGLINREPTFFWDSSCYAPTAATRTRLPLTRPRGHLNNMIIVTRRGGGGSGLRGPSAPCTAPGNKSPSYTNIVAGLAGRHITNELDSRLLITFPATLSLSNRCSSASCPPSSAMGITSSTPNKYIPILAIAGVIGLLLVAGTINIFFCGGGVKERRRSQGEGGHSASLLHWNSPPGPPR